MIKLTVTNSLSIKAVQDHSRVYVLARCKSNKGNQEVAKIPAEYGIYWYPLVFYFDYHYMTNYKAILLKVDPKLAPDDIIDEYAHKNYFLHNFYDYRHDKLGKDRTMFKINAGITTKLKSMGMKTWDLPYNLKDVSLNYEKLDKSMQKVENAITLREQDKVDPDDLANNPMDYANHDESTYLSDLGMGYRMNGYMRKVARAMYGM